MHRLFFYILYLFASLEGSGQVVKQRLPDKLVVLSFDDAVSTHYSYVAPVLKKYGFGATFFVCEFPPDYADSSKYMNWRQIQALSKMGFEIGNHTRNHKHVNRLSEQQLSAELEYIEKKCDSLGIAPPVSFAYPGYDTDQKTIAVLRQRGYQFARTGGDTLYYTDKDHPYLIPGYTTRKDNPQMIMNAFSMAAPGKIVVLTIHGVPDYDHDWVTTPPELFDEYMKYLHDQHFTVIAMKDLAKYINTEEALNTIAPSFPVKK